MITRRILDLMRLNLMRWWMFGGKSTQSANQLASSVIIIETAPALGSTTAKLRALTPPLGQAAPPSVQP